MEEKLGAAQGSSSESAVGVHMNGEAAESEVLRKVEKLLLYQHLARNAKVQVSRASSQQLSQELSDPDALKSALKNAKEDAQREAVRTAMADQAIRQSQISAFLGRVLAPHLPWAPESELDSDSEPLVISPERREELEQLLVTSAKFTSKVLEMSEEEVAASRKLDRMQKELLELQQQNLEKLKHLRSLEKKDGEEREKSQELKLEEVHLEKKKWMYMLAKNITQRLIIHSGVDLTKNPKHTDLLIMSGEPIPHK